MTYTYVIAGVDLAGLQADAVAAGLPVTAVNGGAVGAPDAAVITSRDLSPAEKTTLDGVAAAHDGAAARTRSLRASADALLSSDAGAASKATRAAAIAGLDEVNSLRGWLTSFAAAVAAASSLADLKTRVAALPALPQRTKQQLLNAATGHVDDGTAD